MNQLALNFEAARTRGDLGAERAAHRAERNSPGWIDVAAEKIRDYVRLDAAGMAMDFTIEKARQWAADKNLPAPPDARAWGHVTRRAVKLGYIVETGEYAPAASSNGSPKRLYRKGPNT